MRHENRAEYRSVTPGARVFFRLEELPALEHRYLAGMAENMALGGLFIATHHPLRPGSVIRLQLYSAADPLGTSAVHARAIVRWRRVWREPRGMGVQFLDFEGLGVRRLESWFDTVSTGVPLFAPPVAPFQPSP